LENEQIFEATALSNRGLRRCGKISAQTPTHHQDIWSWRKSVTYFKGSSEKNQ
jgi:hypothetical protein